MESTFQMVTTELYFLNLLFARYMYWCEWRGDPIIRRAYMDGTNLEVIYSGVPASGLTIDYEERRLYWTLYDTSSVESVNLIGKE